MIAPTLHSGDTLTTRANVLFVGINYRYMNLTNLYLPAALARAFNAHFYGPGFVSDEVLKSGIERYVESIGGVDVIFATKDFCAGLSGAKLRWFTRRSGVMLNGGETSDETCRDISQYLKRHREHVISFLTDLDPHSVPQQMVDIIQEHAKYHVGWGSQFLNTLADTEWVHREEHLQKKVRAGVPLGLLDQFAVREQRRIISIGFYVAETEFYWGPLVQRPYDVAVPGTPYVRREHFLKSVKQIRNLRVPTFSYKILFQIGDAIGLRPYGRFYSLSMYNAMFQRTLSLSKSCVTDGGANNYPVRKFFEIPAAGALLVCPPAVGMESLGFKDGINYVAVRKAEDVLEVVKSVAADPGRYESIAASGRDLVFRRHSLQARSDQLREAVQRIVAGTFEGSHWEDGDFVCPVGASRHV
jgi:hypothetical protein